MPEDNKTSKVNRGRPPITVEDENLVLELLSEGKCPAEIIKLTGLSQTKVYELRRSWQKQNPQVPDRTYAGVLSPSPEETQGKASQSLPKASSMTA